MNYSLLPDDKWALPATVDTRELCVINVTGGEHNFFELRWGRALKQYCDDHPEVLFPLFNIISFLYAVVHLVYLITQFRDFFFVWIFIFQKFCNFFHFLFLLNFTFLFIYCKSGWILPPLTIVFVVLTIELDSIPLCILLRVCLTCSFRGLTTRYLFLDSLLSLLRHRQSQCLGIWSLLPFWLIYALAGYWGLLERFEGREREFISLDRKSFPSNIVISLLTLLNIAGLRNSLSAVRSNQTEIVIFVGVSHRILNFKQKSLF